MAKRRRNRRNGGFLTVLAVLVVIGILAVAVIFLLGNPFQQTGTIVSGSMGAFHLADAVIVRNEKVTDVEGLKSVTFYADEGELVYTGRKIAETYATGYSLTDLNKLMYTRGNIKSLVKTELTSRYNDTQLDSLDEAVQNYAREMGLYVRGKAQGNLVNLERQLTSAMTRRHNYLRERLSSNASQSLIDQYDTESSLVAKIKSGTTTFVAKSDVIISFYTDGYETMLGVGGFNDISAGQARSVLAGDTPQMTTAQRGRTAVFREVEPQGWYLLLLSNDKDWNPVQGQTYSVKLNGFEDLVITGQVTSFARSGNEVLVRMEVTGNVRSVLNTRTASAEVYESNVSGLQVPVNALHFQNDQWGVVLSDGNGIFVPVDVLMQDQQHAVIESRVPDALHPGQKVILF